MPPKQCNYQPWWKRIINQIDQIGKDVSNTPKVAEHRGELVRIILAMVSSFKANLEEISLISLTRKRVVFFPLWVYISFD